MLKSSIPFSAGEARASLASLPEVAGVFALFGEDERAEPYLNKTTNLKRRLMRFLAARPEQTKRLQLAARVVRVEWTATGSELESQFVLYEAATQAFGEAANKKMKLRSPAFLRMAAKNPYPRVYVTNKITKSAEEWLYGPFPSRVVAERFCDEALNLFLHRRCVEDLNPDPAFPGCVYGDMKMCLAPCFKGCSDERYAEETEAVAQFMATRGGSLIEKLTRERDAAAAELEFEKAAALHEKLKKVQAVAGLAAETVRPLSRLSGVILQPSAEPDAVAVFLLRRGLLAGPAEYSVAGMRHPNEQSGSSSLFAHPVAMEPVPLGEGKTTAVPEATFASRGVLEERLEAVIAELEARAAARRTNAETLAAHLCLYTRWYYRPEAKRVGEVFFDEEAGGLPRKAILRGISRVFRAGLAAQAGGGAGAAAEATAPVAESGAEPGGEPGAESGAVSAPATGV